MNRLTGTVCSVARSLLLLLFVFVCTGCAVFSVGVESLKSAGVTESDRQALLQKQAKEFHDIMTFGRVDAAAQFVEDEIKPRLLPKLTKILKTDKFVEHTVMMFDLLMIPGRQS